MSPRPDPYPEKKHCVLQKSSAGEPATPDQHTLFLRGRVAKAGGGGKEPGFYEALELQAPTLNF